MCALESRLRTQRGKNAGLSLVFPSNIGQSCLLPESCLTVKLINARPLLTKTGEGMSARQTVPSGRDTDAAHSPGGPHCRLSLLRGFELSLGDVAISLSSGAQH